MQSIVRSTYNRRLDPQRDLGNRKKIPADYRFFFFPLFPVFLSKVRYELALPNWQ